jgi:hypothetical protein
MHADKMVYTFAIPVTSVVGVQPTICSKHAEAQAEPHPVARLSQLLSPSICMSLSQARDGVSTFARGRFYVPDAVRDVLAMRSNSEDAAPAVPTSDA